ncbi:MAG: glycerol-3-phosphate 1-O-acyltransferase PlsY [Erysipelothrix sp.]|nr:glycerol-3-phosphate 1-O-acyltransferase PlsY [Erysipelothrix sp.]
MRQILAILIGYLIGSIPFALVIGKVFYKVDIREMGSGNLGGTNAGRNLGAKAGVAVAVLDVLKATLAMTIVRFIAPDYIIYAGFFATLGHCFPVFANFRGGKAVSTAFGFLLGITIFLTQRPLIHLLLPLGIFFLVLYLSKMVSFSAMIALTIATALLFITQNNLTISLTFLLITIIVIYRHKENINRIINKEERKITWM